ncbi:MAG: hypothetical protein ACFFCW_01995 [Candidatus Hodarchaeota archaeon]
MKKITFLLAILIAPPWTIRAQDTTYTIIVRNEGQLCIEAKVLVPWGFSTICYYDTICYSPDLTYKSLKWPQNLKGRKFEKSPCYRNKQDWPGTVDTVYLRVFHIDTVGWRPDTIVVRQMDMFILEIIDSIPILDTTEAKEGTYYVPRED